MAIISKVITGFVIQQFDTETRRFINQEFIGGEVVAWEDEQGKTVDEPSINGKEPYLNMEMVQPTEHKHKCCGGKCCIGNKKSFKVGDAVIVTPPDDGSNPQNEFQGVVYNSISTPIGELIQVRDQDGNVFDCVLTRLRSAT